MAYFPNDQPDMLKKLLIILGVFLGILLIVFLLGPIPKNPVYKNTAVTYSNSLTHLEDSLNASEAKKQTRKGNQAHILWANNTKEQTEYSILYLNGFAGSNRDGYPLNKMVAETYKANLYMARMAGHGLKPTDTTEKFTAEKAWEQAVRDLAFANALGKKTIIMSTSTGGTLALKLAAEFPEKVFALLNISPNIRDEQIGASVLNTPWGYELACLIFLSNTRHIEYEEDSAAMYWDTIYPVKSLVELQKLVETTMKPKTYQKIKCPVFTIYYFKNFLEKDWRVDTDLYPDVYEKLSTPKEQQKLVELETPGTHFIGSSIKSNDYITAYKEIIFYCENVLKMENNVQKH